LEDFEEYRRSLDAVINHWEIKPEETYFIGHSTGCSIIFDYLLRGGTCKATLWAAPLVRFRDYDLVHTLISDQGSWNPQLPVSRTPSTSNEQFYQKKWQDPQRISVFEISWARSIIRWNEQLPHSGDIQLEQPVTILQGLRDRVVWYDYNIPYLQSILPNAQIIWLPQSKHHIFNETRLDEVYWVLGEFLSE
jgi:pimeloyl-ACP methyl ester carboxylesterase